MVYTGIIIIFLLIIVGLIFISNDIGRKNDNFNRYEICFKDEYSASGAPLIELDINGDKKWFLVDSGASISLIKKSYLDSLEGVIESVENKSVIFTGSDSIKSENCMLTTSINKKVFKDEVFCIAELNVFDYKKEDFGRDVIGIIGGPILEKYRWTICYDKMKIYINK